MKKKYLVVKITCDVEYNDILIALLGEEGYDSFMETDTGFEAYIEKDGFRENVLQSLITQYSAHAPISYTSEMMEEKNWNEEWEKNYDPIIVEDQCLVRATFHQIEKTYPYEIVITPKMSFGTGHHATTYLMLKQQMALDHTDKRVLDAGCGTAILAIMAEKLGASEIIGYDIDAWSIENAPENVKLNNGHVKILQGTIATVGLTGKFDIILANINKNVLLEEIRDYEKHLADGGVLILSGFYTHDEADIVAEAEKYRLKMKGRDERNDWACVSFKKV